MPPIFAGNYISNPSSVAVPNASGGTVLISVVNLNSPAGDEFVLDTTLTQGLENGTYELVGQLACAAPGQLQVSFSTYPACKQTGGTVVNGCQLLLDACSGTFNYTAFAGSGTVKYLLIEGFCGMLETHVLSTLNGAAANLTCVPQVDAVYIGTFAGAPVAPLSLPVSPPGIQMQTLSLALTDHILAATIVLELPGTELSTTYTLQGYTGCVNGKLIVALSDSPADCQESTGGGVIAQCGYLAQHCSGTFSFSTYIDSNSDYQLTIDGFCGLAQTTLLTCSSGCSGSPMCSGTSGGGGGGIGNLIPGPGLASTPNPDGTTTITNTGVITANGQGATTVSCALGICNFTTKGVAAADNTIVVTTNPTNYLVGSSSPPITQLAQGATCGTYDSGAQALWLNLPLVAPYNANGNQGTFFNTFPGNCGNPAPPFSPIVTVTVCLDTSVAAAFRRNLIAGMLSFTFNEPGLVWDGMVTGSGCSSIFPNTNYFAASFQAPSAYTWDQTQGKKLGFKWNVPVSTN